MKKEVEELIRLFKKLKEVADKEDIVKDQNGFYQNIYLLLNAYEMIKDKIPDESFGEMNSSMRKMIQDMISQLKVELGEHAEEKNSISSHIRDIDEMLKNPDLTASEIDHLLDEKIKQNKIKNIKNE
jgi:uncharacterized protein YeeX (DUF496 family)